MENLNKEEKESFLETYYEIACLLEEKKDNEYCWIGKYYIEKGTGGMYLLAQKLTEEFQTKFKNIIWGEDLLWFDTITQFVDDYKKSVYVISHFLVSGKWNLTNEDFIIKAKNEGEIYSTIDFELAVAKGTIKTNRKRFRYIETN